MERGLWHDVVEVATLGRRASVSASVVAQDRRVCSLDASGPPIGRKPHSLARSAPYGMVISERKMVSERRMGGIGWGKHVRLFSTGAPLHQIARDGDYGPRCVVALSGLTRLRLVVERGLWGQR